VPVVHSWREVLCKHLCFCLLQPVRHTHLAAHRRRGGEVLLRLLALPRPLAVALRICAEQESGGASLLEPGFVRTRAPGRVRESAAFPESKFLSPIDTLGPPRYSSCPPSLRTRARCGERQPRSRSRSHSQSSPLAVRRGWLRQLPTPQPSDFPLPLMLLPGSLAERHDAPSTAPHEHVIQTRIVYWTGDVRFDHC